MTVKIDQEKCTGCALCVKACPEANVIKKVKDGKDGNKKFSISSMFCKMCLLCASVCAKKAIVSEN
ncbi:MAG: 4Fe-4S binding protein [Chitinispirillales bacterium]|jgi:Pyruvate/2-oxoacid:ferredoxin oxidoreductase delta subunit|nr:4Fe-4S binding protein [Chitinispirillales bacterium]